MLAHFCSLPRKKFTVLTSNPKESPTVRNCSNQEERHRDKTLAHTINVQTVTDSISRRVTSGRENNSLILVSHGVKIIEGCCYNVMLFLSAIRSIWSKFFLFQQGSNRQTWRLRLSTCFTYNFTRYRVIFKILSRQTQQWICNNVLGKDLIIITLLRLSIINNRTRFRLLLFSGINISQDAFEVWWDILLRLFYKFTAMSVGGRILKIGQYLVKVDAKI